MADVQEVMHAEAIAAAAEVRYQLEVAFRFQRAELSGLAPRQRRTNASPRYRRRTQ